MMAAAALALISCPNPIDEAAVSQAHDSVAPSVVLTAPDDQSSYAAAVIVQGQVQDLTDIGTVGRIAQLSYEIVPATLPGGDITGQLAADGSFSFQFATTGFSGSMLIKVRAEDWNGNESESSITLLNLGAISTFTAAAGNGSVALNWDPVPLSTGYTLYYTTDGTLPSSQYGQQLNDVQSPLQLSSLNNGSLHVFRLQSHSSSGADNWSDYAYAVPLSANTLVPRVVSMNGGLKLRWNDIAATDGFEVWRSLSRGAGFANISGTITGTTFVDPQAQLDTTYYYKVRPALPGAILSDPTSGVVFQVPSSYPYFTASATAVSGLANDVVVSGSKAYVATSSHLVILDLTTPGAPSVLGSCPIPGAGLGVAVAGNYAYVACGFSGLRVINISAPTAPAEVCYSTTNLSYAQGVTVSGSYAYVADDGGQLEAYSLSALPGSISWTGGTNVFGPAYDVAIQGAYAYVAANYNGLVVVSLSNPAVPSYLAYAPISSGHALGIAVSGTTAYVACAAGGLRLFNISTPSSPSLISAYDTPGKASGVVLNGSLAAVADDSMGLCIVDVSVPISPVRAGAVDTPGMAHAVSLYSGLVVVADDLGGVCLVAAPAQPQLSSTYVPAGAISGSVNDVVVQGGIAFLAVENSGIDVVDVSNPSSPQRIGSWNGGSLNLEIAVQGNLALLAAYYGGFYLLDVSNPAAPFQQGYVNSGYGATTTAVSGDRAYFCEYNLLRILDISKPSSVSVIGTHIAPDYGEGLCASGSMVYAADQDSGLQFVDAANAAEPLLAGYYTGSVNMMAVDEVEGFLYAADNPGGRLMVFDVRAPASPTPPLATLLVGGTPSDVCVAGGFAFVVGGAGGLKVLDVQNPALPRLVTSSAAPSNTAKAVASEGQYVYVADGSNGLRIIDLLMGY